MHGLIEQNRPFPVHPPQFATFSPLASQVTKHHQDLLRHSATEHLPASQVTGKQQDRRR